MVECAPEVLLQLAAGTLAWEAARALNDVRASGVRSDLSGVFPLFKGTSSYEIRGADIDGIDDLYDQLNELLMADQDWRLGSNLDALNDALYAVDDGARFVWLDHQHSRAALGRATTEAWLQAKLADGRFNHAAISNQLAELRDGTGLTYFELVLQVFADHPRIDLDLS